MKNESSPKALAIVGLIAIVAGGGFTFWQYAAVSDVKAKLIAIQSEIPTEVELKQSLADSSAKLVEFEEKVKHLEESVPDIAYVPTLMKELEKVGEDLDIDVIGVRPVPESFLGGVNNDKTALNSAYDEVEIEVTIRGLYDDSKRFLDALEEFPKIVAVTKVDMKPERSMGESGKDQIETKIFVKTYVFPFDFSTLPTGSKDDEEPEDATVAGIKVGAGS